MHALWQDLRYGARMLGKNPGFTAVAVLTLALGIGANTAIFSVVNAVLLRPLPYPNSDRLVFLAEDSEQIHEMSIAYPNYLDWRQQNHVFDELAIFQTPNFILTGAERPERVPGLNVSANFLATLGVAPLLGRDFRADEDNPGARPAAIMSYGLWKRALGGSPDVIGKSTTLSGTAYTVVGILPATFNFYSQPDVLVPIGLGAKDLMERGDHPGIYGVARLKPGVSVAKAQTEMSTIARRLEQEYPKTNTGNHVIVNSLHEELVQDVRPAALVLFGAVGLVLLIACVNVANLLLARAASREKEFAIRLALGAGRRRIVRQLLTESILLAALGGILGLLLGIWWKDGLVSLIPEDFRRLVDIRLDRWVLAFSAILSGVTGVVFGLIPALQGTRSAGLYADLKEGTGRSTGSVRHHRVRHLLVVSEVALALTLLITAGLTIRSFYHVLRVNPGFRAAGLLTMQISLPGTKYSKPAQETAFFTQLLERVRALPGVVSVGAVTPLPLTGEGWQTGFYVDGQPIPQPGQFPNSDYHFITPDYFRAMDIRLLRGRVFNDADNDSAPRVAIVSETFAQRYWPNEDPVGKRIHRGGPEADAKNWLTVVGIVSDTKQYGLDAKTKTEFYVPYFQDPILRMTLAVRTTPSPLALSEAVRSAVLAIDPDEPVYGIRTMDQWLEESIGQRRVTLILLGSFAGLALLLAAIGIYGVMTYNITQRTHEIGIRMALGAQTGDVLQLFVGQGLRMALLGVVIGLAAAFGLSQLLSSLLFGVSARDPLTFAAVAIALTGVALAASYIPARRAMEVDPMVALRYE